MNKIVIALFSSLLAMACSSAPIDPSPAPSASGESMPSLPKGLRLDTGHAPSSRLADLRVTANTPVPNFSYFGGPVASNLEVIPVFWGSSVAFAADLPGVYATLTDSEFVDWMAEYSTPTQHIGRGHSCTSFTEPTEPPAIVTDAMVKALLQARITDGSLPPPNGEREYLVHLPASALSTIPLSPTFSLKACVHYCAYHLAFPDAATGALAYYSVLPDQTNSATCARCENATLTNFQNTTQRASHQVASVVTDPASALFIDENDGTTGWADHANFDSEIGDECEGQFDTVSGITVQKEWSNAAGGCIAKRTLPANDFNLIPSSPIVTLHPGTTATQHVQFTVTHGRAIPVQISVGALPAGVHAALSSSFTRSDKSVDLTFTVDANAASLSETPITLTATAAASVGGSAGAATNAANVFVTIAP